MILADLGAEVYKVEKTGNGDDTRSLKGFGSGFFTCFNRNKQSISLDLKHEKGRDLFLRLVEHADVLIENFGPGAMNRLGLDYESCRARNESIIYCSLKGFMPGPYENRPALDEVVQMMGGLAYMTGPSGRPLRAGASVTDIVGGSFGAIGILAALIKRRETGVGQFVKASLFESVAFLVSQHIGVAAVSGEAPPPMPERGRAWSVYDLFTTADGEQLFIGVTSDKHFSRLCTTFGYDDWLVDDRLATNQGRIEARDWFLPELGKRLARLDKKKLMALAEEAGIPFAPVNRPVDLVTDEHLIKSGGLDDVRMPGGASALLPKLPLQLDNKPLALRRQPPRVGEGARELFERIGVSEIHLKTMVEEKIIQLAD